MSARVIPITSSYLAVPGIDAERGYGTQSIKRVYRTWQGNNSFFCNGRVVTGPQPHYAIGSILLILLPSLYTYTTISPYLSPEYGIALTYLIPVSILSLTFYYLARCAVTEPGILL
eukprot:GHVN01031094.1.p1 GENE.GHVN01031094.1~~GHVN01031094.1.p1  ORF type:complete len:127 (-),score=9.62 GHVN01031094.1:530-877(-)